MIFNIIINLSFVRRPVSRTINCGSKSEIAQVGIWIRQSISGNIWKRQSLSGNIWKNRSMSGILFTPTDWMKLLIRLKIMSNIRWSQLWKPVCLVHLAQTPSQTRLLRLCPVQRTLFVTKLTLPSSSSSILPRCPPITPRRPGCDHQAGAGCLGLTPNHPVQWYDRWVRPGTLSKGWGEDPGDPGREGEWEECVTLHGESYVTWGGRLR